MSLAEESEIPICRVKLPVMMSADRSTGLYHLESGIGTIII